MRASRPRRTGLHPKARKIDCSEILYRPKEIATNAWTLAHKSGWRVENPVVARAADAKVDALVQQLERTRAEKIETGTPTRQPPRSL